MGVTTRGYPYPELADAIDNGAGFLDVFRNMMLAIDADVAAVSAASGLAILDRVGGPVGPVNTVAETDLYRKTVAANTIGATGGLRLLLAGDYLNNSGGGVTQRLKLKFGATTVFDTGTGTAAFGPASNANRGFWYFDVLLLNTAANAQVLRCRCGQGVQQLASGAVALTQAANYYPGVGSATEDTTANKDIAVTCTLSVANANFDTRRTIGLLERIK